MTEKKAIQCPTCETTFAVAASVLDGRTEEKFHCSRCDSLFALTVEDLHAQSPEPPAPDPIVPDSPEPTLQNPVQSISLEQQEGLAADIDSLISGFQEEVVDKPTEEAKPSSEPTDEQTPAEPSAIDDWLGSSAFSSSTDPDPPRGTTTPEQSTFNEPEEFQTPSEQIPAGQPLAAGSDAQESAEDEIFRPTAERPTDLGLFAGEGEGSDFTQSASLLDGPKARRKLANTGEDLTSIPAKRSGALAQGPVQTGMEFSEEPKTGAEKATPTKEQSPLDELSAAKTVEIPADTAERFRAQAEESKTLPENPAVATHVTMGPVQEELPGTGADDASATATAELFESFSPSTHMQDTGPRVFVGAKSVAFISAPILLFLIILGGANYLLSSNSSMAEKFVALFSSQPQVAPAGLLVENTAFEPVILPTGEKIYLLSGKIANRTSDTIKNVVVEGVAFDEGGDPLSVVRTAATSTIERSELTLMSIDNIKRLQHVRGKAAVTIPAGSEKKFTLALIDENGKEPQFYTARIFSVSL